ncbi:MAG: thioredoxin [Bacteroidales bacterium]|nr:thioredoxin [Bacteroidales bacterium]
MKTKFEELIEDNKPVLVDFFATWCEPCKVQAHVLELLSAEMGDKVRIIKIDVEKNPKVAQKYQIQGVPTLVVFKKGNIVWRNSGVHNKEQLVKILREHL